MIDYPKQLNAIFNKLHLHKITALIVGGYLRDTFLKQNSSKDIDIELYGVDSLDKVATLLEEFGSLNSVGKNFGVLKLSYKDYDLDFSLPRRDNKVAKGHKGFIIEIDTSLSFKEAAKRRDFTMNAMGYDVINKTLLDPYQGRKAIKNKSIVAVDLLTFEEDPLRVLRAVVFASRFNFHIDKELLHLMQKMVLKKQLQELPKERIFEEMKKIFFKSPKPSQAFLLFRKLHLISHYFIELAELQTKEFKEMLEALDRFALSKESVSNSDEVIVIMLALIVNKIKNKEDLLQRITTNKKLTQQALHLAQIDFSLDDITKYTIYKLANKVSIALYLLYLKALYPNNEKVKTLEYLAKELGVYKEAKKALLSGKDLLDLGIEASKKLGFILEKAYDLQLQKEIIEKEELIKELKKRNLLP